jgi:hypothetical protein
VTGVEPATLCLARLPTAVTCPALPIRAPDFLGVAHPVAASHGVSDERSAHTLRTPLDTSRRENRPLSEWARLRTALAAAQLSESYARNGIPSTRSN